MIPKYLNRSLAASFQNGKIAFTRRTVADLVISSGELVACDPLTCPESLPFTTRVAPGRYPLDLSIAEIGGEDQRVAFAILTLSSQPPSTWDLLTIEGQDITTLAADQFFGYGVDSGTGCFMDREARDALLQQMAQEADYFEVLIAELEKTYRHTWSWMNLPFGPANLVAFSTGYGDGAYATYGGYDSDGHLAVIVTDFGVVDEEKA